MAKIFISVIWFLIFFKILLFWVWLWQLKGYHWGRFKAYFETQKIRKLLFGFYGIRYPKLTSKVIIILFSGILLEIFIIWKLSFQFENLVSIIGLLTFIILAPIFSSLLVLFFQIPTTILIKRTLEKARIKREGFKNLIVIGITGSYGKTSTKEFLFTFLSQKYRVLKTRANANTTLGVANTILKELNQKHEIFICEIGAYKKGEIKKMCEFVKPKIGILTGINEQHLAIFGSQENIISAKFELIESLPENGTAILNMESNFIKEEIASRNFDVKNKKFCAINKGLDIWAENIIIEKESISFKVFSKDGDSADFKVNLLGGHNVMNVLLAVCCAKELGINLEEVSRACLKVRPEQGGMKFLRKESPVVLDSSYSANPDGVIADLEYLKIYQGKKVIIMPCLIELGRAAKEVHQRIGKKIAEVCDLAIITTRDYFKEIKKEAPNALLIENQKEIVNKIKEFSNFGDVVLLEGRVPKELCCLLKNQFQYR